MSARQAFVPRPPSRLQTEPHSHPTDSRSQDGERPMFVNGSGKPRSMSAFLGQKRGTGTDTASKGAGPPQGTGLGRANHRRSFEGILRPEITPISIIPYPTPTQLGAGVRQSGAGQTPRKTTATGAFEFSKPMTPASLPRGTKKGLGIFAENQEDEATTDEDAHGGNIAFMGPEGEGDVRVSAASGIGGYMRTLEGSEGGGNAGGLQSGLEHDIAAPVPGYALRGLDANAGEEEMDGIFARSSRGLRVMTEREVGMENANELQRSFGGTKRGMEETGRHTDEGHQVRGSTKKRKQVRHDPNDDQEYVPMSSPRIPPTPRPPPSSADVPNPSLVVGSLLENMEEFVSLEEVEADWKRWKECTTEEWLEGADALVQDYTDILNKVKDHLTEKVLAYATMISSAEEKQTQVSRNIEMIHSKGNVVRENISKLGMKK